jgi:hypothetical protein
MSEPEAERSRFIVRIQAGEECFSVPCERAIVGTKGIFVRNLQLVVGTPVVIRVRKKQEALTLLGVVCANYRDLGLVIEFKEKTGRAGRQLVTLLAA